MVLLGLGFLLCWQIPRWSRLEARTMLKCYIICFKMCVIVFINPNSIANITAMSMCMVSVHAFASL